MPEPTEDRAAVILRLQAIGIGLYDSVQNDPETAFEDEDLDAFEAAIAAYEREPGLIEDINKAHEEAESLEREAEYAKRMIEQQRNRAEQAEHRLNVLAGEVAQLRVQLSQAHQDAGRWQGKAEGLRAALESLLDDDHPNVCREARRVLAETAGAETV